MSSLLCVIALLSGCGGNANRAPLPTTRATGFWVWEGLTASAPQGHPIDDLYVHTGDIQLDLDRKWIVSGFWPSNGIPTAREYWAVFRFDRQDVPDITTAPKFAQRVKELFATKNQIKIVGVQLDIDSPTGRLTEYAAYLAEVEKSLPKDMRLSITALLDWFRDGTNVDAVIAQVDEFVPQFYDAGSAEREVIAAKVDAAKWGARFNRFGKRYRIGISTFGRAKFVSDHPRPGEPTTLYREVTPFDLGSEFALQATHNDVREAVLTYRAVRETSVEYQRFEAGEGVQFVVPTPDGVRAATAEAKKMGGYAAGVVYFRWPGEFESLLVPPEEIFGETKALAVETVDGGCVAVQCVDVELRHVDRFAPGVVRYRVRSSAPLDYFLPVERIPVRLAAPDVVELTVPPFAGRDRLALGRAVSTDAVTFTVEAVR